MALTAEEQVRAAEEAVLQLKAGLAEAGVTLPSLRVDPLSVASEGLPLVELGRCNLDTALRLAAVLEGEKR
ncbi:MULTISPECIES: hypothetical protein [Streptomyces]|uniref:Uncharacterized protein n=1 Tax=Streptomyces venezuelae TaxID=54571 RepID=A0A5P2BHW8_STRVZ|nr:MULTISPECIES: hypothetical protein [Streptomyces]NEA02727.1 hypothetical protein [Streptomyces sp. SID10116]MYY82756.1 hypothetical protein [Streptomyces sp. SID335]MYZ14834.1 hypothetical protein [Streptomyces sp. SID337]NDZ88873.1 hypothetical protein [Streptomyces sp. SID10115]NEB47562.1 hypothetical protein [Streptomyces sp. SID339]